MNGNKQVRLVVSGCCGRMGSLVIEEAAKDSTHFDLVGAVEHSSHPQVGQPLPARPSLKISADLKSTLRGAELLIEFTTPEATVDHARMAADAKVPMIIGTTGLSPEQVDLLFHATHNKIPIFLSPNMSIGIFILRKMIRYVSERLSEFGLSDRLRLNLSEAHHAKKKDWPSGTAKQLSKDIQAATGQVVSDDQIQVSRDENFDVVGIHSVTFELGAEKLTLTHEATDRRLFAQGALLIARHYHQICKEPKAYGMDEFMSDFLNLKRPGGTPR